MPQKKSKHSKLEAEIVPPSGMVDIKQVIARMVEQQVSQILAQNAGADFEPFFQPQQVTHEIRRRQTVTQQQKWTFFYEDWGCMICETKKLPHSTLGMCKTCYGRTARHLRASLQKHAPPSEKPPAYTENTSQAREALTPYFFFNPPDMGFIDAVGLARDALTPSIPPIAASRRKK